MKLTIKIHPQPEMSVKFPDYEIILEDDSMATVVAAFKKIDYIFQSPIIEYKSEVEQKVVIGDRR